VVLLLVLVMATAGFLSGVIAPLRDMLVHTAVQPGGEGSVFFLQPAVTGAPGLQIRHAARARGMSIAAWASFRQRGRMM
jgi:hypothetical protein